MKLMHHSGLFVKLSNETRTRYGVRAFVNRGDLIYRHIGGFFVFIAQKQNSIFDLDNFTANDRARPTAHIDFLTD